MVVSPSRKARARHSQRGSAILFIMFMVLAIAFVVGVAATFGRQTLDIEHRYERDVAVKRTWDAALAMVDAKSANSTLGLLPASIPFTLNGVSCTLTVASNSANVPDSLLVTSALTASDGTTYQESGTVAITGGYLGGTYWWTNGSAITSNYLAWNWMNNDGTPTGTFTAALLNYAGTSAGTIQTWLSTDSTNFSGTNDNLTDGVVLLDGYITTTVANTIIKASSEYGSYVSIDGDNYVINTGAGNSLGSATVTIPAAGTYPIFATYYNHSGTTAADFQLQWSTNAGVLYSSIPTYDISPLNQNWVFNGSAIAFGNGVELVDGGANEAGSAWLTTPQNCNTFHGSFDFRFASATADGFTFTMQNVGTSALGTNGYGLGIGGIGNSISLTFQLVNPTGYWNMTDDGNILTANGITLSTYGINLASGDLFHCAMTQSGSVFNATLTDESTGKSCAGTQNPWAPSTYLGSTTGYVGFTGSTGSTTSQVYITNLNFGP